MDEDPERRGAMHVSYSRTLVVLAFAALLTFAPAFCLAQKPEGKFSFSGRWIDEEGQPVAGLGVDIGYTSNETHHVDSVVTDKEGKFTFTGNSISNSILVVIGRESKKKLSEEGWYRPSSYNHLFKGGLKDGVWGPTPEPIDFVIKKRGEKVVLWHHGEHKILLPEFDKSFGYDILKRDLVAPHGEGEVADVAFKIGRKKEHVRDWSNQMTVTWAGEGNGFLAFDRPPFSHEYPYPTKVPTEGYQQERFWENGVSPDKESGTYWIRKDYQELREGGRDRPDPPSVLFRIRSKKGADGKVMGVYGKMYREFFPGIHRESVKDEYQPVVFGYGIALNPEEGNTMLEFNRYKNAWPELPRKEWSQRP